jgi:hypothetical protein
MIIQKIIRNIYFLGPLATWALGGRPSCLALVTWESQIERANHHEFKEANHYSFNN